MNQVLLVLVFIDRETLCFSLFFILPKKVSFKVVCSPSPTAGPTSLKMGVTKADKHCDLGCLFTESPDW